VALVISARGLDKRSVLYKTCVAAGSVLEYAVPDKSYLAEQQAAIAAAAADDAPPHNGEANGLAAVAGQATDADLAALLAEVENLSDEEAARLLADEGHRG